MNYDELCALWTFSKSLIAHGPRIDWDTHMAALGLGIKHEDFMEFCKDGRSLSRLATTWLGANGFEKIKDGKSGYCLAIDGKKYRLRVGTKKLSLAPSSTKGMGRYFTSERQQKEMDLIAGHILIFTADLPNPKTWFIDKALVAHWKSIHVLDDKWAAQAQDIRFLISPVWEDLIEQDKRKDRMCAQPVKP
jgi:hypothetical protein